MSDPDIIERYNLAFSKGWKSPEWQDMPTLKDFTRFCSITRLNISKPEAIDHQAINQITSQIAALLVSPLGNAIAKPSQMSDDSQNSDTSQQILQNISKQLKNNATIGNLQLQEASQARQDRALGLTLTAQAAQELNAVNTRERQSAIATGNSGFCNSSRLYSTI